MTTMSLGKLKSMLPFTSTSSNNNATAEGGAHNGRTTKAKGFLGSMDPEVGFQMTLVSNQSRVSAGDKAGAAAPAVPELHVKIVGARHLPSIFGLKTVQGYVAKIKLFPGTLRFDTSIQTASWPTFNETFKFPMEPTTKSSFKSKVKHTVNDPDQSASSSKVVTLPERLFKGHFLVLTVFALLELPAGTGTTIKHRLQQIRRKSSQLLANQDKSDERRSSTASVAGGAEDTATPTKDIMQLTRSEQRRNIGSVTCFLDPRMFEENVRSGAFCTEEMWLTVKDITVTQATRSTNVPIASHPKGQVELILQICDLDAADATAIHNTTVNPTAISEPTSATQSPQKPTGKSTHSSNRWTLGDVRRKLSISGGGSSGKGKGLCLKVTISKMRCSIKVKEQFENMDHGGAMYIKTSIFEHDILANSWKSDQFAPSLSVRWSPEHSEMRVPLHSADDLRHIAIRTTIATKSKLGKKIVLGTVMLGGRSANGPTAEEHWSSVADAAGGAGAVAMWHAFE